ncbi:MAG: glycosyltransferase family 2 protein [Candidatus Falkowbacteria bacterium]
MDLSVIIVSWNVREKLKNNLQSLFASSGKLSMEVFVVDNNSADGTAAMVAAQFPQVKLIANNVNLGFAKANNLAIKQAQGDFILLLNPDMQLAPDTLIKSLEWAKNNSQATVSSCRLVDEKNNNIKPVRRFPRLYDQLAIVLKIPHFFPFVLNGYLQNKFDYAMASKVDSIRGAFFLINSAAYQKISNGKLPLLDERYFLWFEEVDFCREVYKMGGEVWYTPVAVCTDYVGASFSQVKRGQTQQYFRDSMLSYFQKWEAPWKYQILKLAWRIIFLCLKK